MAINLMGQKLIEFADKAELAQIHSQFKNNGERQRLPIINPQYLDFARTIGKRLDEHRETVEDIESSTRLFSVKPWKVTHMATMDDYLMWLYFLRHGFWPDETMKNQVFDNVRKRSEILGRCQHPKFKL